MAGGETAGIPFAVALAGDLAKPVLYVRKKPKDYGIATRLEGELPFPGARVLLVEDLITDGGSKLTFIEALRDAGAVVEDALVLFDREQGGTEVLATQGVRLHSVTDRKTAFAVGHSAGLLDADRGVVDRRLLPRSRRLARHPRLPVPGGETPPRPSRLRLGPLLRRRSRSPARRYLLRRRMFLGVTSTASSSWMNSSACSRLSRRGGIRRFRCLQSRKPACW